MCVLHQCVMWRTIVFLLACFPSLADGITYNCINKNNPSPACCSGEITLDPTMTTIGNNAFRDCTNLTGSLIIPSSVTSIGSSAFYRCSGLTGSLVIPSSVTSIGGWAFRYCSGFTGPLTIPSSLTSLGGDVFAGCSGFTGPLTILSALTSIVGNAFNGCSGLTGSLTIPPSVTSIGNDAFSGCSGLTGSLIIPPLVTSMGSNAFRRCSGFTGSLIIPPSVTSIGNYAFHGCTGFSRAVTFPNSVSSLGISVFSNLCHWLSCCGNCTKMCICDSSCEGVCAVSEQPTGYPTAQPTGQPTRQPTSQPTGQPTFNPSLLSFVVKIGDGEILSSRKAIHVDYLHDVRRGKMVPISRIINSTPNTEFPLSPDSILIQWCPLTAVLGMTSWESSNRTMIVPGGVFVSWLVNLSTEEIMGFIIQNPVSSSTIIYFIQSWTNADRNFSISNPGISVSNLPNKTLSSRTILEYVLGVSDQQVYLLNSGLVK